MNVRKAQVDKWPIVSGNYKVGSRYSSVAVMVVGTSEGVMPIEKVIVEKAVESGAAIAGICKTANIGLERVIVNIVSNPNIRYLIVTGLGDNVHRTGKAIIYLWKNGIDPATKKIICDDVPEGYLPNLPLEAVERFRKQVTVIDVLPREFRCDIMTQQKICIGSRCFRFRGLWLDGNVFKLVVTRLNVLLAVQLLVHCCLQEPENRVTIHVYGRYSNEKYELYDLGAYPREPLVVDITELAELQSVAETLHVSQVEKVGVTSLGQVAVELAGTCGVWYTVVHGIVPVAVPASQLLPVNSIADLDWIVIGRFRRFRDGYETLKKFILERGITRPTRHGDTFEISVTLIYEELPWFRFREEEGRIVVEDFDFSDVEQSTYPIKSREYFRQYCENLLNGEWPRLGLDRDGQHYTYGAQLRRFGYDLYRFAEHADIAGDVVGDVFLEFGIRLGLRRAVRDQLRLILENIRKMPLERCHVITFWQPALDTACRRAQPCFVALQFMIVPRASKWILNAYCYMRSHDFLNAHLENAYGLAAIINYIVWKLKQKDPEQFEKLEVGRLKWEIVSCHIYKEHVGLR